MKLRDILAQVLAEKSGDLVDNEGLDERKCGGTKKIVEKLNDENIEQIIEEIDDIIESIAMMENGELDDDEIDELAEAIACLDDEIIEMFSEAAEIDEDELSETLYLNKTPMSVRAKARKYARSSKGRLARKKYLKKLRRFKQKIKACKKRGLTFSLRQMKCVKPKHRKGY